MEMQGNFENLEQNYKTRRWMLTVSSEKFPTEVEEIIDSEALLDIKITKHREKKSLNANAYAWVLMQKIAEKTNSDKWSVYLQCLQRYSRSFTHIIVKENAVARMKELYRTYIDLGEISVNGMTGHQLQVYYGSSTFDSKEMSVFIDGIVSECKDLGIETLPPAQLEIMNKEWNNEKTRGNL